MSAGLIKAGSGYIELFLKSSKLDSGLTSVAKKLSGFSIGIGAIGASMAGYGAAITGPLTLMAKRAAESGDHLAKMAGRTNTSVEALSELGFAAEQSGQDIEVIERSLTLMQKAIGSSQADKKLAKIGLTVKDLAGLSPDKQFEAIADAISKIDDPSKRTAAMFDFFGRTGTKLGPLFKDGAAGIQALRQEAHQLGLTANPQRAKRAEDYIDAWNRVARVKKTLFSAIGNSLIPLLTDWAQSVLTATIVVRDFVKRNTELVPAIFRVASVIGVLGTVITAVGTAGLMMSGVILGFGAIFGVVASVIAAILSPLGLVIVGVVAAVGAFLSFTQSGQQLVSYLTAGFMGLLETVLYVWGGISNALAASNWALAGQIAMTALEGAILAGVESISSLIGGVFGDVIATIGTKLIKGDLQGAWNSTLLAMGTVFSSFVSGVVGVFTSMTRSMIDTWSGAVEKIANKILDMASEGGVFGTAFEAVTGVNIAEERARAERLNAEARRRGLATTDFGATAQAAVTDSINSWASGITSVIDQADSMAQNSLDASTAALDADTANGMSSMQNAIAQNRQQLNALIDQAKKEREAMNQKQEEVVMANVTAMPQLKTAAEMASIGTFSGAAAAAASLAAPGVGVQERMAETLEDIRDLQEENNQLVADGGGEFGP